MATMYLIGGKARSGKTILRRKLCEEQNISGLCTDTLRAAIIAGNPHSGIDSDEPAESYAPIMWPYIDAFIENITEFTPDDFVLEGNVLLPEFLRRYQHNPNIRMCMLGFADAEPKQKARDVREYADQNDWTNKYSDVELMKFARWGKKFSKKYRKECKKYDIDYFDTSKTFEKSINEAYEYLTA